MKKLTYILLVTLIFASCKKSGEDLLFDRKPETRMLERNAEFKAKLLESPNGWKAYMRTSLYGGAFAFYMRFNDQEQVSMLSDWSSSYATNFRTSTYRIQYVMNTSLIFDTYTYISRMMDPDSDVNGGYKADGLRSDIEFEYVRSSTDTLFLRGKKYGNYLYLIKANPEEEAVFNEKKYWENISKTSSFLNKSGKYIEVPYEGQQVKINLTFYTRTTDKTVYSRVVLADKTTLTNDAGFAFGLDEVYLYNPIKIAGYTFVKIKLKSENNYVALDEQGKEYPILFP